MPIQRLYTGKNSSVELPDNQRLDHAQENMSRMILDADKIRLEAFKENEKWFLNNQNIDQETFLVTANATAQEEMIKQNNLKWEKRLKEAGGDFNNFSGADKVEMQRDRAIIESAQKKMLGDQEKYKMASQLVNRDPNLDPNKFNKIMMSTYFKGLPFPDDAVDFSIKAKNPGVYFNNNKAKGTEDFLPPEYRTLAGGKQEVRDRRYGSTVEQTKEFIAQSLLNDPGLREGVYEEFEALPESQKWEYLKDFDTDKSGTLDATERGTIPTKESKDATNPILRYAQDKYLELAREDRSTAWKSSTTAQGGGDTSSVRIGTRNVQYVPTKATSTTIEGNIFPKFHSMQLAPMILTIKTGGNVKSVTQGAFASTTPPNTVFTAMPIGYDEDSDSFIFTVTKDFENIGLGQIQSGQGQVVAIPRTDISNEALVNGIDVLDDKGNKVKVGQIKRTEKPTTKVPFPTWIEWKKTNPNGTPEEYNKLKNG